MCESVEGVCHTVEVWMPNSPLLLGLVAFVIVLLVVRFFARNIPAVGI